jgi:tetratricopeptide (TPR) repeat protein
MSRAHPTPSRRTILLAALAGLALLTGCAGKGVSATTDTDLEFAGEMAQMGNWREAIYRWQRALEEGKHQARIYNNLAVGYERLGEWEKAAQAYEQALEAGGKDIRQIEENYRQFLRFYRDYREREVIGETGSDGS